MTNKIVTINMLKVIETLADLAQKGYIIKTAKFESAHHKHALPTINVNMELIKIDL